MAHASTKIGAVTGIDPPPIDIERRNLAYLATVPVDRVKGIGPKYASKLEADGIRSVADLLLVPPRRYLDRSQIFDIASAPIGEDVTVGGTVIRSSTQRISRGRSMVRADVTDGTSTVQAVWFNPWIRVAEGDEVALSGKVEVFRGRLQMKGPALDRLSGSDALTTGRVVPVYGKLAGAKPADVRRWIANAIPRSRPLRDVLPDTVRSTYGLIHREEAIARIHFPDTMADIGAARRRLTFDEFLWIQMALRVRAHDDYESQRGVANAIRGPLLERYLESLPFELTDDQRSALDEILDDMANPTPLHRLLQGEVGSGKTVVVVAAMLTSVESGHQAAVMAPTEVLAAQHYLGTLRALEDAAMAPTSFHDDGAGTESLFEEAPLATRPVRIGLFTSQRVSVNFRHGDVSRDEGLAWLADGTIDMAFGTHALIQPDVAFASLGITVVDEQHRFGVEQRVSLRDRDTTAGVPDLLLMTATPIPRTFVMALYGDLDVSTITTLPPGRSAIATDTIDAEPSGEDAVDAAVRSVVEDGRQAFVVCPLVDESDKIEARSAIAEHRRLSAALPDGAVGLLHGQMPSADKATVMESFRSGSIRVLVATTVIEVGIDVPNATLIVVWNAERFGLSQLHQLRGRVGRGEHPGACLLVVGEASDDAERRMAAMVATNDGFALANVDLEIRGHGTLFGASQSGAGDLRFGDLLRDVDLIEAASRCAVDAVADDRYGAFVTEIMEEFTLFVGDSREWLDKS